MGLEYFLGVIMVSKSGILASGAVSDLAMGPKSGLWTLYAISDLVKRPKSDIWALSTVLSLANPWDPSQGPK